MNDKMTNCFSKEVRNHSVKYVDDQNQQHKTKKAKKKQHDLHLTWRNILSPRMVLLCE